MTWTMMRAPTRVRYNGPKGTSKPPRGKTKSRSLPARHGGQAAGRPHHRSPTAGDPFLRQGTPGSLRALRAGGMTEIGRQSLIGNDKHSRANATALERITSI